MKAQIKSWLYFFLSIIILASFQYSTSAEENTNANDKEVLHLSLDDCLDMAMVDNVSLQRADLGREMSYLNRIRNEGVFDPGFELDLSGSGSDSSSATSSITSSNQIDMSFRYTIPTFSGSLWSFSLQQGRNSGNMMLGGESDSFESFTSQIGAGYSMPLLEGFGTRVNRAGIQRSDLGIMRTEASLVEAERNLRFQVVQVYIQGILSSKQILVMELSLSTAENLVTEVQARIDVGQRAPYELLASQAGLAVRQEALLISESNYLTILDTLKELIGMPLDAEITIDEGILQAVYYSPDPDELFIAAQTNRADLHDIDLRIKLAEIDLYMAEDTRQSSLNWNTILGLSGQGDNYGDSVSDMDNLSWYTGLEYRIPLGGNTVAKADVASARLALDQLELERVDFLRNLQLEIRKAVEDYNNASLRIDVTSQGMDVQEEKMESELLRHDLGLITAGDLLEFDVDVANARLAYDNALADALEALARLEYLVGTSLMSDAIMIGTVSGE